VVKGCQSAHDCGNNIVTIQEDWNGHNNGGDETLRSKGENTRIVVIT